MDVWYYESMTVEYHACVAEPGLPLLEVSCLWQLGYDNLEMVDRQEGDLSIISIRPTPWTPSALPSSLLLCLCSTAYTSLYMPGKAQHGGQPFTGCYWCMSGCHGLWGK